MHIRKREAERQGGRGRERIFGEMKVTSFLPMFFCYRFL